MNRPTPNSNGFFNNYLEDLPIDIQKSIMAISRNVKSWKKYKAKDAWSDLKEVEQDEFSLKIFNEINKSITPLNKYTKIGLTEEVETYEEKLKKGKMKKIKVMKFVKPPIKYFYSFKYNEEEGRIYSGDEGDNTLSVSILFENMMNVKDGTKGFGGFVKSIVRPKQPIPDSVNRMIYQDEKEDRLEILTARIEGRQPNLPVRNYDYLLKDYDEITKSVVKENEVNTTYVRYSIDKNDKSKVALFNKYFPPL